MDLFGAYVILWYYYINIVYMYTGEQTRQIGQLNEYINMHEECATQNQKQCSLTYSFLMFS